MYLIVISRSWMPSNVEAGCAYVIPRVGQLHDRGRRPTSATFQVFWGGIAGTALATLAVPS